MVILPFLTGRRRRTYAAIFSFIAGVIPPMPIFGRSLLYVHNHWIAKCWASSMLLMMYRSSHSCRTMRPIALDIGVLLGLSRLNVRQGDALLFSPIQQCLTDIFRAIVDADRPWFAPPLNDVVQAADDPLCRQGKVHLDAQTSAVEVVQQVQQPERAAVLKPIGHEIHRPGHIRPFGHGQSIRHVPLQPLARLDPQVQLQGAVDPIDALVV